MKNGIHCDNYSILDDEYQLDNSNNYYSESNDVTLDIHSSYLKEIAKYPLLTLDEEVYYATLLKNPETKKLLIINDVDNYSVSSLNIPLLFCSLCDNCNYNIIIRDLLSFYSKLESGSNKDIDILDKYLKESSIRNRSLNSDELKSIFNIEVGNKLNNEELMNEIKKYKDYVFGFDKMFVSNLRLVVSIAAKYRCNMDLIDLINEGNLGLMKAITRFDVSLGYKFSTYATFWIKQAVRRASINNNSAIKIPEHLINKLLVFRRKINELEKEENHFLSDDEIAEALSIPVEKVMEYQRLLYDSVSIDESISDEEYYSIKEVLPSDYNLEDDVLRKFLKDDITELFEALTPSEIQIIKMRYGLDEYYGKSYTLVEIGKIMSLSQQRIRQKEIKALFKMRRFMRAHSKAKSLGEYYR